MNDFLPYGQALQSPPQRSALHRVKLEDFLLFTIVLLGAGRLLTPFLTDLFITLPWSNEAINALRTSFALCLQTSLFVAVTYFLFFKRYALKLADIGLGPFESQWIKIASAMILPVFIGTIAVNAVVQNFLLDSAENPQIELVKSLAQSRESILALLFFTIITTPLIEEVVFRGLLQGWLELRLPGKLSLIIASSLFAAFHGIPALMPSLFVAGLAFGYVKQRTGSLWSAILLHGLFNGLSTTLLLFALRMAK